MDLVLKHYGISKDDAYVFGDSSNDLSMFKYATNCVLMGQHSDVLLPYATFETKDVEDDGIAYAMEELRRTAPTRLPPSRPVSPPLPAPATNRATLTWPTSAPKPKRTRTALPR